MSDEDELVAVSPRHSVRLANEYAVLLKRPARHDFVVRTIMRREANGLPLVSADIVIAGADTRAEFPVAAQYPLHFRKTYFPGRLHGDPRQEFERQAEASAILNLPPPIGCSHDVFRSCFLPGTPYHRLSPFGVEPEESNIPLARKLSVATAAGLWTFVESAFNALSRLHENGLTHGDAELHNFVVCPAPLEILVVDFEASERRADVPEDKWAARCSADFIPLLREAILIQCCLGRQPGPLGEMSTARIQELFKNPERFRREVGEKTSPQA